MTITIFRCVCNAFIRNVSFCQVQPKFSAPTGLSSIIITVPHLAAIRPGKYNFRARGMLAQLAGSFFHEQLAPSQWIASFQLVDSQLPASGYLASSQQLALALLSLAQLSPSLLCIILLIFCLCLMIDGCILHDWCVLYNLPTIKLTNLTHPHNHHVSKPLPYLYSVLVTRLVTIPQHTPRRLTQKRIYQATSIEI